ncbi:MAG: proline--tRNA ligase [Pseudonocardiaceae bacterium]
MSDRPISVSRLWPPVRSDKEQVHGSTFDLLESLGFVRRTAATGAFTLLTLGLRVRDVLADITRDSFERSGFNAISFPALQSRSIWEESGRWQTYHDEGLLLRVEGRGGEEMCLAPTSEEIAVATVREDLRSYRDLPVRLFLSTNKYRSEISPRGGLMRAQEFEMADGYTFDDSPAGMTESVMLLNDSCRTALQRMGLRGVFMSSADGGSISTGPSVEHLVLADFGQSDFLVCEYCGVRGDSAQLSGLFTAQADRVPTDEIVKVIVFTTGGGNTTPRVVSVVIRGDLRVSVRKLAAIVEDRRIDLVDRDTMVDLFDRAPGTLNPWDVVWVSDLVLFDQSVVGLDRFTMADGVDGLRSDMTWDGDHGFPPISVSPADVHCASTGLRCAACGHGRYRSIQAVELGHVFELGNQYSARMGIEFVDSAGDRQTPLMACSGIGITRCLQTIAGIHRDDQGLRWPVGVGPADVHVVALRADQPDTHRRMVECADFLCGLGVRVLVDDRLAPAGDKFHYATALGIPFQVVLSPQQSDDMVEVVDRWTGRRRMRSRRELSLADFGISHRGS